MARGRPVEALILTADERGYLERQVRRHRVTRSLSERCRIVLRCADGLQSKQVAAELSVSEHMVGKWRRRFSTIASTVCSTSGDPVVPARSTTMQWRR